MKKNREIATCNRVGLANTRISTGYAQKTSPYLGRPGPSLTLKKKGKERKGEKKTRVLTHRLKAMVHVPKASLKFEWSSQKVPSELLWSLVLGSGLVHV